MAFQLTTEDGRRLTRSGQDQQRQLLYRLSVRCCGTKGRRRSGKEDLGATLLSRPGLVVAKLLLPLQPALHGQNSQCLGAADVDLLVSELRLKKLFFQEFQPVHTFQVTRKGIPSHTC